MALTETVNNKAKQPDIARPQLAVLGFIAQLRVQFAEGELSPAKVYEVEFSKGIGFDV